MDKFAIETARLDGYLTGVVALNGQINAYYAGAFFLEECGYEKLEDSLESYFAPHCQVHFLSINKLEKGLDDLELGIQSFIVENILGNNMQFDNAEALYDRKKYISFKIMDMIQFLISDPFEESNDKKNILVQKIEANFDDSDAEFTFFSISFDRKNLILQFMRPHFHTRSGGVR